LHPSASFAPPRLRPLAIYGSSKARDTLWVQQYVSEKEPAKKECGRQDQKRRAMLARNDWLFGCLHVEGSGTKEGVAKYVFASLLVVVSDR
jgi:hypothetical protein